MSSFFPTSERRNGALCAILVALAVLATLPFAETGFQDDWSYIRTALDFANTGHFVYNGWATAMLGWVIPWSALFIKIFGFSFTIVRLSMLPVTLACIYLFHASLVRFGVRGQKAVLGALTFGLSPVFLPLATSYMTDVAGMFTIILCLYLCQRAVAARSDRTALLWLSAAAATNVLGGTVRQIAWLGALTMVPATAFYLRRRHNMLITGALLWIGSIAGVLLCLRWWNHQPYSVPEKVFQGAITLTMMHHAFGAFTKAFFCLMLILLPVLVAWLEELAKRTPGERLRVGVEILLSAAGVLWVQKVTPDFWLAPWLTHMIQSVMRGSGEFPGVTQVPWPAPAREAISIVVVASAVALVDSVASGLWKRRAEREPRVAAPEDVRQIFWLLVPFSVAYVLLLSPRGMYAMLYDRYMLGLVPLALVVLLRVLRPRQDCVPITTFAVLAVIAIFSVAGTHDWWAVNRARIAAVNEVFAAGVPKTEIQGAFEYDGWTQIEAAGYINEKRIEVPAGAFHENMRMYRLPIPCWHFFGWYASAINPRYLVVSKPTACFEESQFPPVSFRIWLPPFHRTIYVRKMRDADR